METVSGIQLILPVKHAVFMTFIAAGRWNITAVINLTRPSAQKRLDKTKVWVDVKHLTDGPSARQEEIKRK